MDEQRQQANRTGSREAEDVKGFFTPVPISGLTPATFGSDGGVSDRTALRLTLLRTTLANEVGPANNPRPTPIGG